MTVSLCPLTTVTLSSTRESPLTAFFDWATLGRVGCASHCEGAPGYLLSTHVAFTVTVVSVGFAHVVYESYTGHVGTAISPGDLGIELANGQRC